MSRSASPDSPPLVLSPEARAKASPFRAQAGVRRKVGDRHQAAVVGQQARARISARQDQVAATGPDHLAARARQGVGQVWSPAAPMKNSPPSTLMSPAKPPVVPGPATFTVPSPASSTT